MIIGGLANSREQTLSRSCLRDCSSPASDPRVVTRTHPRRCQRRLRILLLHDRLRLLWRLKQGRAKRGRHHVDSETLVQRWEVEEILCHHITS